MNNVTFGFMETHNRGSALACAGCTIGSVQALEEGAFCADVIRAVCATCQTNSALEAD